METPTDGWELVGAKETSAIPKLNLSYDDISVYLNKDYADALSKLKSLRDITEQYRQLGRLRVESNNPANISDMMLEIRTNVSILTDFKSHYLDLLNSMMGANADRREYIYLKGIEEGKTASAADKHAQNVTNADKNKLAIVKNVIDQISNDVDNYNSLSMALQSIMKEFNTDRIVS